MQTAIVVGGGPAGLATAAQLKRRGLDAVILERGDALAARWRTRYQGLRLNTWRAFSRLPGKRLPRSTGRYPTREALIAYLERYAQDNQLVIRLGVEAQRIERDRDGGWLVVCRDGPVRACNVVVATGWDAEPHLPAWTSEAVFAGELLHASQVRDPGAFADRRVLVVGAGNSGIDLAGLLVRAGACVTVSMRTPPNILPRDWLGVPLGPSALIAERLPSPPADALGRLIQWTTYGDLSSCGIPRAPQGFMTRFRHAAVNPAVDDGFATALKNGRARVVGEVKRLDRDGATLLDGGRVPVNVVICATGYRRGLERLVGHLDVLDDGGAPRYPAGAPGNPDTPGLYFAGFQVALSGSIRVAGIHARRIANTIATDKRTLPIIRRGATGYATELKPSPALRGGCTSAIAPDTVDVAAASPASRSAQSGECRVPGPLSATEAVQPGGSGFVEAGAAGPLHGFAPFVLLANLRAGALSSGRPASPSAR